VNGVRPQHLPESGAGAQEKESKKGKQLENELDVRAAASTPTGIFDHSISLKTAAVHFTSEFVSFSKLKLTGLRNSEACPRPTDRNGVKERFPLK